MRFKHLLTILIIGLGFAVQAQPGYQGKKLLTTYDLRFIPTVNNKNFNSKSGIFPADFSLTHIANIEYVTSRKMAFGLRYSFTRTSVEMSFIDKDSPFNIYKDGDDLPFKAYVHGLGIYSKVFYGGYQSLAPRGKYITFQADVYYTVVKDSYVDNAVLTNYLGNFSIGMGLGKQMIVFDRVILDYGIESNICLPGIFSNSVFGKKSYDSGSDNISDVKDIVNGRMFDMYIVMFKLGIGFLAF